MAPVAAPELAQQAPPPGAAPPVAPAAPAAQPMQAPHAVQPGNTQAAAGWGGAGWWDTWGGAVGDGRTWSNSGEAWGVAGWEGGRTQSTEAASPSEADEGPSTWWWSSRYRAWVLSPLVTRSHRGRWAWDNEREHAVYFLVP